MTTRTLAALLAATLLGGCGIVPDGRTVVDSATVLGQFVGQLGQAGSVAYTAEYSTTGGRAVTVVRSAPRTAYLVTAGRFIVTPDHLIRCEAGTCRRAANPGRAADLAELVEEFVGPGFTTPDEVMTTVATAAFAPGVKVHVSGTAIAGQPALCGDVRGLEKTAELPARFSVCVTDQGIVASYTGMELRSLSGWADGAAFDPPPGATVVDVTSLR